MKPVRISLPAIVVLTWCMLIPTFSAADDYNKAIRRAPGTVAAASEVGVGELYALVVGVARYKHPSITRLRVSDKDARDVAAFLKTAKGLFRDVHVKLLLNDEATRTAVEKELYYSLRRAGKDDTVILFFSGHGADDPSTPGEFFFLTHDADPDFLAATSVNMGRQSFLQRLDARRVVLIADACHAGGYSARGYKSMQPSLKTFMAQFKESEGRVFLTSSRADELSREKPGLANSVFTHYLLLGLKGEADRDQDNVVTLQELYDYVYRKTKNESGGFQSPQMEGRLVGAFPLSLARVQPSVPYEPPQKPFPATTSQSREPVSSTRQSAHELFSEGKKHKLAERWNDAIECFRKAAQLDHREAQYQLARLLEQGFGARRDLGEAILWYCRAGSQRHLGAITRFKNAEDDKEFFSTLQKRAEKGDSCAQFIIGKTYERRGNHSQARRWIDKSISKGLDEEARWNLWGERRSLSGSMGDFPNWNGLTP